MSARKILWLKQKFLTVALLTLSLALSSFLFPRSSFAFENPQRYYDWGPSSIRVNPQVLGAQTDSTGSAEVQAATASVQSISKFSGYFFGLGARLNPGDPFYFLKTFQENLTVAFTPNPVRREELRLQIAGARVGELQYLSEKGKTDQLTGTSRTYFETLSQVSENLDGVKDKAPDAAGLLSKFEEESSKHLLVLSQIALKVPEAAKDGLERAISSSEKVVDQVADLSGRPALPADVLDRIQALKAQGLLSAEEAQKLVSAGSRVAARVELRRYAAEGIFPEADVSKLNELARARFRDDFNKAVEYEKFFELKRLEEEKPDEETVKKVQEFAKSYKAGEIVPPDLRRYWLPLVRLEELQNTIRPDLIDPKALASRKEFFDKFQELVERTKPRPEDMAQLGQILSQNPNAAVDPFYERVLKIAEKFGAACGGNFKWVATGSTSGYCAPENSNPAEFVQPEFQSNSLCGQALTAAQGPGGVCVTFPNTCLPANWRRVDSCAATPTDGFGNQTAVNRSCPSNAHWARVAYMPDGGYCVPNITYTGYGEPPSTTATEGKSGGPQASAESTCPAKYHRNYPGGPCLTDTYFGPATDRATYTPGYFPAPVYGPVTCPDGYVWSGTTCLAESRACGFGTVWDRETRRCTSSTLPYFPKCGPNEYSGPNGVCTPNERSQEAGECSQVGKFWTGRECLDKAPEGGGGVACPENQVWDAERKFCSSGGYGGGSPSRESQEAACRAGGGTCVSWVNNACGCERPGGQTGTGNVGACPTGQYIGPGGYCVSSYGGGSPSRESQEAACRAGGGTCVSWVNNACGCERPGGQTGTGGGSSACPSGQYMGPGGYCISSGGSGGGGYVPPYGDYTPPSGYGSCSSGQYWNGSSCVSSTYTPPSQTESPEQACLRGSGCSWTGSACNCPSASPPTTTSEPAPTTAPAEPAPATAPPAPSGDSGATSGTSGTSCPSGSYWSGSACVPGQ